VSFLDDLPDEPKELVRKCSEERQVDRIRKIEDRILEKSLATVEDFTSARDIDPGQEEPPPEWVAEHGPVEAAKRWRVARAAWDTKKDSPVFLGLAKDVALGIIKAREGRTVNVSSLNVAFVVAAPPKVADAYPIIDVEVDDADE